MKTKKKPTLQNPNFNTNPLAVTNISKRKTKTKKKKQRNEDYRPDKEPHDNNGDTYDNEVKRVSASEQLEFFLSHYQSANALQLSSLELDSIPDTCILELSQFTNEDSETLGNDLKLAFGPSWKEVLCGKKLSEGKVDAGNPAVLIISTSALRAIELLRGARSLTKECHAVKLFSKHMKVEEQVSLLKNRVNVAGGTPNRIKKLIDMEALGMSRLSVIVLDIRPDVKSYSLLTLPQVRDEFWDLYKNYFHQQIVKGSLRLGLYGPLTNSAELKWKKKKP